MSNNPDEHVSGGVAQRRRVQVSLEFENLEPGSRWWQFRLFEVIFGVDTAAGRTFDIVLLGAIILSIVTVMLDSVEPLRLRSGLLFIAIEWTRTILFTLEYVLRLASLKHPWRYARSFLGIVDLLAILPSYLSLFFGGSRFLTVVRAIRLLRVFRILRLISYLNEFTHLVAAIKATQRKILVFLFLIVTVVLIMGSLMYVVEGPENGFTSIPQSIYWAIVTMTTVGYGDIAPKTILGKTIASMAMIIGYSMIIVPTGVFTVEIVSSKSSSVEAAPARSNVRECPHCGFKRHDDDAHYCKICGQPLDVLVP